jgi:hypothetical protein
LRVREPLGRRRDRRKRDDELWRLMESGDYSAETIGRIAELPADGANPIPVLGPGNLNP